MDYKYKYLKYKNKYLQLKNQLGFGFGSNTVKQLKDRKKILVELIKQDRKNNKLIEELENVNKELNKELNKEFKAKNEIYPLDI